MDSTNNTRLANMGWPWQNENPFLSVILTSDEQFLTIATDPDLAIANIHPHATEPISLRDYCRQGAASGATSLRIAFDYFFGGHGRSLYPDTERFQEALKKVHDVAQEYGLGLEPSILSPLELGVGYRQETGESGRWMHYREGLRDPLNGCYSLSMWQHLRWTNNKGPTPVSLAGVRAFAFKESSIPGSPFFSVNPDEMVELATPTIEILSDSGGTAGELDGGEADGRAMFKAQRIRVSGAGGAPGYDRVLVVLLYETVEMDYFSPSASGFLDNLVQGYQKRGITMTGIYSDEMHIQQDWSYHAHHDSGQFAVRYVSPGFERAFAAAYGDQYGDLARYMIYFCSHQHGFLPTHEPKLPAQHVFGQSEEAIYQTLLFRRNYYNFLEEGVVDLMVSALHQLERLNGRSMDTFYHATWAESPTCDAWSIGGVHQSWSADEHRRKYEYTPDFIWSNTVHQAASACANYFAWNDFLTGGNNDTAEGGYSDRNYYGRALACSLAALNRRPLAAAHMWGMPAEVRKHMTAVTEVYGAGGHPAFQSVADYQPRKIEVMFVSPQDLVAVDEQFGSWMVQYGYANYITADKLETHATFSSDGQLVVNEATYDTLCILYEPFPSETLLTLMLTFVRNGGTLIWSSTPPMLDRQGRSIRESWMHELFGVKLQGSTGPLGMALPARQVRFEGQLDGITPMAILTDFVVDRVFPVDIDDPDVEVVARIQPGGSATQLIVGTRRKFARGGQAIYLGFRPRDDQAASTGREISTWFDILQAAGAYGNKDNPTILARTCPYFVAHFPNGAIGVAPHYRHHEESWYGSFFRDETLDQKIVEANPLPGDSILLDNVKISGQTVSYKGNHSVIWRLGAAEQLLGFAGYHCSGIKINSGGWHWSEVPVDIAWHPLLPEHETERFQPLYRVWIGQACEVSLPLQLVDSENLEVWLGAFLASNDHRENAVGRAGFGVRKIPFSIDAGSLVLKIDKGIADHWLYIVRRR